MSSFWEDAAVDHGTTTEGGLRYRFTKNAGKLSFLNKPMP